MAAQEPNPEVAGEAAAADAVPVVQGPTLLARLKFYHPFMLLGLALALAVTAVILRPKREDNVPRDARTLYSEAEAALDQIGNTDHPLDAAGLKDAICSAYGTLDTLVRRQYGELKSYPSFVNPFLLYGEACALYARNIPLERERRLQEALAAYAAALEWEKREWDKDAQTEYDRQFSLLPGDEGRVEIEERKRRRNQYLRYRIATLQVDAGNYMVAKDSLVNLRAELRREQNSSAGDFDVGAISPVPTPVQYPPHRYEMVAEDKEKLGFYLGWIYERLGEAKEAEREYQSFLLNARRSEEMFLALMRLGDIYMKAGDRARAAADSAESETSVAGQAVEYYGVAADKYSQVVAKSAPEELLREAYFRGGMAMLAIAASIDTGGETWWDRLDAAGNSVREALKSFAGRELPERSRGVPEAIGRLLLGDSASLPSAADSPFTISAGAALGLAAAERQTTRARRDALLGKARNFFDGARGGTGGRFTAASQAMTAYTLLTEGKLEEARRKFRRTGEDYPDDDVQVACVIGESTAYLLEGDLDKAKLRLLGGREKESSSALTEESVVQWADLSREILRGREGKEPSPASRVWELLPPDARETVQFMAQTRREEKAHRARLLTALNAVIARRDFYVAANFSSVSAGARAAPLLARDRESLTENEVEWLNRLLLEAAFPQYIIESDPGIGFPPLPPAAALPDSLLFSEQNVTRVLRLLSRLYIKRARDAADTASRYVASAADAETKKEQPALETSSASPQFVRRRSLEDAAEVNEFLLANYNPDRGETLMETAGLYRELAEVAAARPYLQRDLAHDLVSKAAGTYLRVAHEAPGSKREKDALWQSGRSFYRAAQYGRATEALSEFLLKYGSSDQSAEARNLLARAYRNLGLYLQALREYREVAVGQTPEAYKAAYYLGWIDAEQEKTKGDDGKDQDLLGDPAAPLPQNQDGVLVIGSALQSFNYVRRLPRLGPDSRAWRWATFDLGRLWLRLAEREREKASAGGEADAARSESWLPLYREAEEALRESLNRYLLKRHPTDAIGLDPVSHPEDYGETVCARFASEYDLAQVQTVLGEQTDDADRLEKARAHLRNLITPTLYPDLMFDPANPKPLYFGIAEKAAATLYPGAPLVAPETPEEVLGNTEGPTYDRGSLRSMRRSAFFLLGQSFFRDGAKKNAAGRSGDAEEALNRAYSVYQAALDRLPPVDAPQVLYLQGESLREMGRPQDAAGKYTLAVNTWRSLKKGSDERSDALGPDFWGEQAEQRLKDLDWR